MAPKKPSGGAKVKKKAPAREKEDRVVKRPARGYHKFRNGMLNVTSKGQEEDLVTINQASPLLRLPAEIRNQIWRLVVGGKVIREQVTKRGQAQMLPRPCERTNTFALLRVCRQIYAETALLPFSANTFLFRRYWDMGGRTNDLRKHQYSQIRDVQLEVTTLDTTKSVFQDRLTVRFKKMQLDRRFPGLQRLHVCVFPFRKKPKWSVSKCEAFIRTNLAPDVLAMGYGVTIEKMRTGWPRFNRLWTETAVASTPGTKRS